MILSTAEKDSTIVAKKSQMGETAVVSKENDLSPSKSGVDLTDLAYSNRELVSYENASVNIDNSNDVIIGPVTQFNVNGNVTIVQGGYGEDLDPEDIEKRKSSTSPYARGKIFNIPSVSFSSLFNISKCVNFVKYVLNIKLKVLNVDVPFRYNWFSGCI